MNYPTIRITCVTLIHIFFAVCLPVTAYSMPMEGPGRKDMVIICPVENVRSKPIEAELCYIHDDLQETQVLFNEYVILKGESGSWYLIEAAEQKEFTHNKRWEGYPGWIRKSCTGFVEDVPRYNAVVRKTTGIFPDPARKDYPRILLSAGTRLNIIDAGSPGGLCTVLLPDGSRGWITATDIRMIGSVPGDDAIRRDIVETARLFIGVPYLWGGRSMYMPEAAPWEHEGPGTQTEVYPPVVTGVDCSGLTNLVYRINGIDIPRDTHEQWMVSEKISLNLMRPGDMIFIQGADPGTPVFHVMIYTGGENFIEAYETGSKVTQSSFMKKFGIFFKALCKRSGVLEKVRVFAGRVIGGPAMHCGQ